MDYAFLKNFTFDGKETSHLFQIAKVTIPFLSKENELLQVGNSNGSTFLNTRRTTNTIQIDGFMIKDNSGMSIYDTKDELVRIINTNEPKQLVFDMFPNRYFNAIYSGIQEYDATDPKYTPLTLTFDVPDGVAHNINPSSYTNVYATSKNLVFDSEYNHIGKYLKPWVQKLDEKFNNSNVVQADFTNGIPLNFEGDKNSDERWINWSPATTIHNTDLKVGDDVNFSVYAQVVSIDEENNKEYAGQVILEEWDTVKGVILKKHIVSIPKKVITGFTEYGSVINIEHENTNAINLQYGFIGTNIIKWSKPMISFLPPIGETVTAPSVGAKAYSNTLEFGGYDYSGNSNISLPLNSSSFSSGSGGTVSDDGDQIVFTLDGTKLSKYKVATQTPLVHGKTYTISCEILLESDFVGDASTIRLQHSFLPGGNVVLQTTTIPTNTLSVWQKLQGTTTINYGSGQPAQWYSVFTNIGSNTITGHIRLRNVKIEEGSTATPYQPNLLDAPYYLSKVALGENIADPTVKFPITTSSEAIYAKNASEDFVLGETYTVTIGATKPASQTIRVYLAQQQFGVFKPVEGLVNTWVATVSITQLGGNPKWVYLSQTPNTSLGSCIINWLKIEKGNTRTPNIPYYKYEGI